MVDERAQAMNLMLTLPINDLLPNIYPNLYSLHTLCEKVLYMYIHKYIVLTVIVCLIHYLCVCTMYLYIQMSIIIQFEQ